MCCYIPPSVSRELFSVSINCLQNVCSACDSCILVGDFNLPNIEWKKNSLPGDFKSQLFLKFLTDCGFVQYIDEFTRNTRILDLLCCNDPLLISEFSVSVPFYNSDHEAIEFSIAVAATGFQNPSNNLPYPRKLLWQKAIWESFANFLINMDWDTVFSSGADSDEHWHCFSTIL